MENPRLFFSSSSSLSRGGGETGRGHFLLHMVGGMECVNQSPVLSLSSHATGWKESEITLRPTAAKPRTFPPSTLYSIQQRTGRAAFATSFIHFFDPSQQAPFFLPPQRCCTTALFAKLTNPQLSPPPPFSSNRLPPPSTLQRRRRRRRRRPSSPDAKGPRPSHRRGGGGGGPGIEGRK